MDEQWRPVVGYEGFYEVSNLGAIRSVPRWVRTKGDARQHRPGRVLVQKPQGRGYMKVSLSAHGVVTCALVHRVVCSAWHGVQEGMDAAHINGIKTDNRTENLYWATRSENIRDQVRHNTHQYASRDRCTSGHEYTPETTAYYPSYKGRYCKTCSQIRSSNRKAS